MKQVCVVLTMYLLLSCHGMASEQETYPGTKPLTVEGDIASEMIDGIDRFLLDELEHSIEARAKHWDRDLSGPEAYEKSIEPNRKRLAHIVGLRDPRVPFAGPELVGTTTQPALVGRGSNFQVYAIRWPAFGDVHGEGLLLVPTEGQPIADVVAIPDADQLPEEIVGLVDGVAEKSQFARRLAENGCRVIVPVLIDRQTQRRAPPGRQGRAELTNREYVYRSAFELGRHLIGYELQKVLAAVDWFAKEAGKTDPKIGVIGYGEGGLLALYAGALDTRIDAACVSGYFGSRQRVWTEPIDRNVFGLLEQFGDAEVASLVAPRVLIVDSAPGPQLTLPSNGGAPAELTWHTTQSIRAEKQRLFRWMNELPTRANGRQFASDRMLIDEGPASSICGARALLSFLKQLARHDTVKTSHDAVEHFRKQFDPAIRQQRQIHEIDRHNQALLAESPYVRAKFMEKLDKSSLAAYEKSVESYRDVFRHEVVGHFDRELLPANPRSRKAYDEEKWTGYEVMLDVFPNVFAYGVLCVPKNIPAGEKRPVVVCQHGLEGRPQDVITGNHRAYHDFAAKLAERGFITFAPQNIYIFRDRFRTLQRKANPIKKTLFSIMVPQHQQIVNWLKSLPMVDDERIAFYGLSYGGKSAMRIPPLVTDYCLSICSADFNEWVRKNASSRHNFSYVWTGEYEIFEWDLGSTFNYAEMAALICPRPFMVERGHFDGVGTDEWVGYEFGKVRHLYAARLGIPDRCEIEWFYGDYKGIHTINGQGTFAFLHKHLDWPER